jgi:nickel transport protein
MRLRFFLKVEFLCVLIFVALTLPGVARAHGTGYRVLQQGKAVTLECYYSDGTAMSYAETYIFSPEDSDLEHQNARTDKKGRISFFPDTPGTWRVTVSDGMGHKIQGQVMVAPESEQTSAPKVTTPDQNPAALSKPLSAVLGISLIFNLCLGVLLVRRRK